MGLDMVLMKSIKGFTAVAPNSVIDRVHVIRIDKKILGGVIQHSYSHWQVLKLWRCVFGLAQV